MYKIIGADGKDYGPVSREQLREWIVQGRADAQTRVLPEGTTDWKPLGSLPELAELLSASPQQPPAPPAAVPVPGPGPLPGAAPIAPLPRTNPMALTGMILGIVSMTLGLCCCYGFPFNVAGIVVSLIGLSQIKRDPEQYTGRGMAIAGLLLSIFSILLGVVLVIVGVTMNLPNILHELQNL